MPVLPEGIDSESPGSRFTLRPAIAVLFEPDDDGVPARDLIVESTGGWVLEEQEVLGAGQPVSGGFGRGWEVSVPVVEWLVQPAVAGVVGALTWELTKAAGRKLLEVISKLREQRDPRSLAVSRGAAGAIAATAIDADADSYIEAIEEPDYVGGSTHFMEENYVGIQPWIVLIVDRANNRRHIVVVSPEGTIRGHLMTEREPDEATYYG